MANVDKPSGFKPVQHLNGSPWNGKFNIYYVPATDNTAIGKGDLVQHGGTADPTGKYPVAIQSAATTTTNVGVVIGCGNTPQSMFDSSNLERKYRPGATAMYLAVVDDPTVIFEIQENGESAPFDITDVGLNCDVIVAAASTVTGLSGMEIDSDNYAEATASAQVRLLRVAPYEDNELGAHCKWWVLINEHVFASTVGA